MEITGLTEDFTNYEIVEETPNALEIIQKLQEKIQILGEMLESVIALQRGKEVIDLTHLAEQVGPSVVRIETRIGYDTIFHRDMIGGIGSGSVITSDGYILTNHHVIDGAKKIKVFFQNTGLGLIAQVIGSDPETDLAVIKVDVEDLCYSQFANSDHVKVGEGAVLVGNPLGFHDLLSVGVVSGKSPTIFHAIDDCWSPYELGLYGEYILTDTLCNPGNSGGPLFNMKGDIIGVCAKGGFGPGGGTAMNVTSNTAVKVIDELMTSGYLTRASLGVQLVSFDDEYLAPYLLSMSSMESILWWNDEHDAGLLVGETIQGSAANLAGLQRGDILVSYNDIDVTTPDKFFADLAMRIEPKSTLKLTLVRGGKTIDVMVPLDAREVNNPLVIERLGIRIENLDAERTLAYGFDPRTSGVIVTAVRQKSELHKQNLRPGDVVTAVILDGKEIPIRNIDDVLALEEQAEGEHDLVLVVRSNDRSSASYFYIGLE